MFSVIGLLITIDTCSTRNAREYRRGTQKWTTQRNWQHIVHKTKKKKTKIQHNMRWTPHETSQKQLEVKTNRTSFLRGNRNGHHNTELRKLRHLFAEQYNKK
jgi:hypothetical protein